MKALILPTLLLAAAIPVFAQTPGGPPPAPAAPQPAAPAEPATPASPPAAVAPTAPAVPAAPAAMAPAAPPQAVDSSRIIVPAETTIPLMLQTPINTKSAYVGESFYCETVYPITVGNHIIIPRGSSVRGSITQVVRPGRVKGRAQIGLRFDQLVLPNGTTVELRAVLSGFGSSRSEKFKPKEGKIEGEGSKGQDAGKVITSGVTGTEMGTLIGLGRGAPGEGAAIGAGAGAAAGLIWVLASRGRDAILPHGTSLELKLIRPLNFSRWEVRPHSRYDDGPSLPNGDYGPR